jgi:hypothetical protein
MPLKIIENYTKNSVKEQKYPHMLIFLSFPRLKIYFNYLTVCKKLKNPWVTGLNFVNLRGGIIFLLCE